MDFLNDPKTLHYTALNMWANWLETSDPTKPASRAKQSEINNLNDDQRRLVLRLRDEARLTLQAKS